MAPPAGVKTLVGRNGAALAAAAVLAILCYLNTCQNRFVFDDVDVISRNPLVTGPVLDLPRIFSSHYWLHLTPRGDLYRPLVIASYALNYRLSGQDPAGYHAVNLALHALCSALVVWLGLRFGLGKGGSLAAGLLFAAHPIHTEAVAGLVGRAELMSAAAILAGWAIHLGAPAAGPARTAALMVSLSAGLLSKENAAVLPGLMLVGDLWRVKRGEAKWRAVAPAYLACGLVIAGWLVLRASLLEPYPAGSGYEGPFRLVPSFARILTALDVMGRYVALLILPLSLSADYSFEQIPVLTSWSSASVLIPALLLVAMTAIGIRRLAFAVPARVDGLCLLLFVVAVAPVSNLLVPIGTIMGERLIYLPSVGFCLLLPALWAGLRGARPPSPALRRLGAGAVCFLTAAYSIRTIERNRDWKDQLTLFSATTAASPRSAKAHYNLGVALEDAGRREEALEEYLTAASINPADARSHHNAGLLLAAMGRTGEATAELDRAARLDPTLPRVFSSLGAALTQAGRKAEAEAAFRSALERDPADHVALYNLGTLHILNDRPAEAIPPLERARDLDPSDPDGRYQLGLAYLMAGRPRDAVSEMEATLALSPAQGEAHLQLALAWLRLGDRDRASSEAALARASGIELPLELKALSAPPGGAVR